ncbi:hypothetical protein L0U85_11150 [Glycomyces sp. L485]|nr:hypothetical protein [Glycomyces sp. L485]
MRAPLLEEADVRNDSVEPVGEVSRRFGPALCDGVAGLSQSPVDSDDIDEIDSFSAQVRRENDRNVLVVDPDGELEPVSAPELRPPYLVVGEGVTQKRGFFEDVGGPAALVQQSGVLRCLPGPTGVEPLDVADGEIRPRVF